MPLPSPLHFDLHIFLRDGQTITFREAHNASLFKDLTTYREVMFKLFESPRTLLESKTDPHAPICIVVRDQVVWARIDKTF